MENTVTLHQYEFRKMRPVVKQTATEILFTKSKKMFKGDAALSLLPPRLKSTQVF